QPALSRPLPLIAEPRPVPLDDRREVVARRQGAVGAPAVGREAGRAEGVGDRRLAVAHEQRTLERDRHPLDDAARAPLVAEVAPPCGPSRSPPPPPASGAARPARRRRGRPASRAPSTPLTRRRGRRGRCASAAGRRAASRTRSGAPRDASPPRPPAASAPPSRA